MAALSLTEPCLDWYVASRMKPGEADIGDASMVRAHPGGELVAVIDGLGHGAEAASAAALAAATIGEPGPADLVGIMRRCHERLRSLRGAVIAIVAFDGSRDMVTSLAVGNVEGVILAPATRPDSGRRWILSRGGVVGYQMPALRISTTPVQPGDLLILATDGIRSGFAHGIDTRASPRLLATEILDAHQRPDDDALVLVARYKGGRDEQRGLA